LDIAAEFRTFWSVHPLSLLQLVYPAPLDDLPLRADVRAMLFESREPMLPSLYLGLCGVALVGAALAASSHALRRFAILLGLAALLMALGRHTPVYGIVAALVPPVRAIRFPAKAMPMAAFAWALLCGMGWDAWCAPGTVPARRWRALVVGPLAALLAVGAVLVGLGGRLAARWGPLLVSTPSARPLAEVLAPTVWGVGVAIALGAGALTLSLIRLRGGAAPTTAVLVGVLAVADLLLAHRNPSPLAPAEVFTARPPVVDAIRGEPHSRVFSYDYVDPGMPLRLRPPAVSPDTLAGRPADWPGPWATVLAARQRLYPSLFADFGLEGSFHRDTLGLYPPYLVWLNLAERASEGSPAMTKVLRMGSVSHVVALHDDGLEGLAPVAQFAALLAQPVRLFRVPEPLPRVHAVGGSRIGDGREGLGLLLDPGFDPAREVLLPAGTATPAPADFAASTRVAEWRPDRIRVEATLNAPGYVVLADGYDPGWRARLDGHPVDVLRADVGLRAVPAPSGTHVLELEYRPPSVTAGLALSALSLAVAAAVLVAGRRARPA
jgi:hypothetical protein